VEHLRIVLLDRRRLRTGGALLGPSTSKISTEWCATMARPASVTMSGCGTFFASQASWIEATTSLAYSCTE
jgi:hypothetical protein